MAFVSGVPLYDVYAASAPSSDPGRFYLCLLDLHADETREDANAFAVGATRLVRHFVHWIPSSPAAQQQPFVVAHPDFDIQNLLVSEDGTLQAILDWDGVAAVLRSLGALWYPGWLTRDWDPAMYGYKELVDRGEEPRGRTLRAVYEGIVQRLLADRPWSLHQQTMMPTQKSWLRFRRGSLSFSRRTGCSVEC